jgi:hypothetical protein
MPRVTSAFFLPMTPIAEFRKDVVAVPKQPLDYKKLEYPASEKPENNNGDIEQPKYIHNGIQLDTGFSGSPLL